MFVYLIVNDVDGKCYIGKTTGSCLSRYLKQKFYDAKNYLSLRSHLYAAIRKHGQEHFQIFPLINDCTSNEALCVWEQTLIEIFSTRDHEIGYNICKGGEGFTGPHTPEWKQFMSRNFREKGYKPSTEATLESIRVRKQTQENIGIWPGAPFKDLSGVDFGGINVLERLENNSEGDARWLCRCRCGKLFPAYGSNLRSGHTRSCGCLKKTQNKINLRRYNSQKGM